MDGDQITVNSTIACCAWLVKKGHVELAREMRDEFLQEWEFPASIWNSEVEHLADYARRKAEDERSEEHFRILLLRA